VTPLEQFEAVWERASHLAAIHAYLAAHSTGALRTDELLRAEWAARVSALDLYVHELVAQYMVAIFEKRRPPSPGYLRFQLTTETMHRISNAVTTTDASAAFDLAVRDQLGRKTFQFPDDIADGIRCCSSIDLWNSVALHLGATQATKSAMAERLKLDLTLVIRRRNKIVHEGDLQPSAPRVPWPILAADLTSLSLLIEKIVRSIDIVTV
jgi:hypothetical protein